MNYEGYTEEEREREEKRQANPTCANCVYCYGEYGSPCCERLEVILQDIENKKCEDWRQKSCR